MEKFIVILRLKDGSFGEFPHQKINRRKLKQWFINIMNFRLDSRSEIYSLEHVK